MDNNSAKRLLDILRNSKVDLGSDPNAMTSASQVNNNTNGPSGVQAQPDATSVPTGNVQTQNPGAMPLSGMTQGAPQQDPQGQVTLPGDQDFQTKVNALKRLQNGQQGQ